MKTKTKIIIALIAVCVSLLEFNLIANMGCFGDTRMAEKEPGYFAVAEFSPADVDVVVTASLEP